MRQVASAIYRLALALWVGGMSVFTFVVTPVIFRTQTRDSAGKIVGALFPVYFRFCLVVTAAAFVARAASGKAFAGARQLAGTALLVFCLAIVSYHAFGLGPRMATVREMVVAPEAAPEEDPARREFSRLHGISMTLNLVVILAGAILILWYDAFRR
ncbi:MAG TPA: DUF4149 domain-containing protein [Candidatus Limnocylindria bacterium]|nr:DUF4149 domain-containing protein [Candidatus Limnocylindria bacterium]